MCTNGICTAREKHFPFNRIIRYYRAFLLSRVCYSVSYIYIACRACLFFSAAEDIVLIVSKLADLFRIRLELTVKILSMSSALILSVASFLEVKLVKI